MSKGKPMIAITKFKVASVKRFMFGSPPAEQATVELAPVVPSSPVGSPGEIWAAQPSGQIMLWNVTSSGADAFAVGSEYEVYFAKVS